MPTVVSMYAREHAVFTVMPSMHFARKVLDPLNGRCCDSMTLSPTNGS